MTRRRAGVVLGALLTGSLLGVVGASPAAAHPLGNFTVNTADQVLLVAGGVEVTHVVDYAEIPTVQLRETVDTDGSSSLSEPELAAFAERECATVEPDLSLEVDGAAVDLSSLSATAETRPGQAGLTTTRLVCRFGSDVRAERSVSFTDEASAGRTGWREVTVVARCGSVESSDVPAVSPSRLLEAYPEESLSAPPDVRTGTAQVSTSGGCTDGADGLGAAPPAAAPRGVDRLTTEFAQFVGRDDLGLLTGLAAVLLSVLFGCLHALAPGHGKTVMAAYLVGTRGTRRQALLLGAFVTISHTASVLLLGLAINVGTLVAPERVVPVTEVLSGVLLAAIGAWLLTGAVRRLRALPDHTHDEHDHDEHPHDAHDHPHPHEHPHGDHDHHQDDDHDHDHHRDTHAHDHPHPHEPSPAAAPVALAVHSHGGRAHSHAPPVDRPLTWRSLATMGVASGLVPSPSVLVVLLGATALGRAGFGVLLVIGYGIGMAATLVAAGLLLLRAQGVAERRGWALARTRRLGRVLPALTAGFVVLLGIALALRGLDTARSLF